MSTSAAQSYLLRFGLLSIYCSPSVILHPDDYEEWLMRVDSESPPMNLLRPFPADEMKAKEAHKDVGNVRNNGPELLNSA